MSKIVNPEQYAESTGAKGELRYKERSRWLFLGLPWTFTKYEIRDNVLTVIKGFFTVKEDDCYMYKRSATWRSPAHLCSVSAACPPSHSLLQMLQTAPSS